MKVDIKHGYIDVNDSKAKGKAINLTVFERGDFSSQHVVVQLTRDEAFDLMAAITAGLMHRRSES